MTKRKTWTPKQKAQIMESHGHKCWRCGKGFESGDKVEFDHMQALARGGQDTMENMAPAHKLCHDLKTFGTKALRLGSDNFEAKKTTRIKKKNDGTAKKAKAKIQSRSTFGRQGYRKKLDGTVVRAEGKAKMS